jgi:hypothetical protein
MGGPTTKREQIMIAMLSVFLELWVGRLVGNHNQTRLRG